MVQENHYGVWGEPLVGIGIDDDWNFLFQGKEYVDFEGLSLYDFGWRLADVWTGRWLTPDPEDQFQQLSPYAMMGNMPTVYIDPDGRIIPVLVFVGAGLIGGGANVISNWSKINNLKTGLAYFGSGALGGVVSVTNPWAGGSITAGGNLMIDVATGNIPDFNNAWDVTKYAGGLIFDGFAVSGSGSLSKLAYGKISAFASTSVSITGSSGSTLIERFATHTADDIAFSAMANYEIVVTQTVKGTGNTIAGVGARQVGKGVAKTEASKLPTQIHHFATNKNKAFTPRMAEIADEFGLSLNGTWNRQALPHLGRHPNEYHKFVLQGMQNAKAGAGGSQAEFLNLFNQYVKQPVIQNPGLLRKSGW